MFTLNGVFSRTLTFHDRFIGGSWHFWQRSGPSC